MYLEKLEIQGFKSFANKNTLVFSGILDNNKKGITSIVGPNGSGKSNIADAVRWVLGEQSSKLLRSKKNDDVIFMGSDKKARLNYAEVSLFLNNNNQVDLNDINEEYGGSESSDKIDALLMLPEIVLTRRVYRDGNSEYLINGKKLRLSDVQIFLAKANFGQKTYSVIGQGMVENFLNTSPAERKAFFDEATGVRQYQLKRDISLNKLEAAQHNLMQVDMLLNEIEPRLSSLTRQVNKLKKRNSLEEELREKQLQYYNFIWKNISLKTDDLNSHLNTLEEEKNQKQKEIEEKKSLLEQESSDNNNNDNFFDLQEAKNKTRSIINKHVNQIELIDRWKELKALNPVNQDLEDLLSEQKNKEKEIGEIQVEFDSLSDVFEDEGLLEGLNAEYRELLSSKELQDRDLLKLNTLIEFRLESSGKFDLSFLISRQNELKENMSQALKDLEVLNEQILEKENIISEKKDKESQLSSALRDLESQIHKNREEYDPRNIKKIGLDLQELLSQIENIGSINKLDDIKNELKAIQDSTQNLIDFVTGQKMDNTLKELNDKLLLLKNEISNHSSLISEQSLELGILKNKKNSLENNLRKLENDLKENDNKLVSQKQEKSIQDLEKNKNEIELQLNNSNSQLSEIKNKINNINEEKSKWLENRRLLSSTMSRLKDDLSRIVSNINDIKSSDSRVQAKIENIEEDLFNNSRSNVFVECFDADKLESEIDFCNTELKKLRLEYQDIERKIDSFNQSQVHKKERLLQLQRDINSMENNLSSIFNSLNNCKIEIAKEETKLEELLLNIGDDNISLESIEKYDQNLDEIDLSILRQDIIKIKNQLDQIGGIDPESEKEYLDTKQRFDFLFDQSKDLNETIDSLDKVITELDILIKDRFDREFKLISQKFDEYFKILFNGGHAKIFPIKEDDDKELIEENSENKHKDRLKRIKKLKKHSSLGLSGVDILAVPPGKKITSINMLSGGERALTSIALICAIISSNPSPFVVLDEVDAALDEANSERLAQILDDLSSKTQFIGITHNRATMKKANILYGVTMLADGVSKLLSVKLDDYIKVK